METINRLRILFVEDLATDQELTERELRQAGIHFTPLRVETEPGFLKALDEFKPDLIISDYSMPEFNGMQALHLTQAHTPAIPFIVLTGSMNEATAVTCMKAGASDYVIKEHMDRLPFAVRETLDIQKIKDQRDRAYQALRERIKELQTFFNISEIDEREGITSDQLVQEFTNLLPQSWQYPEIACARIVISNCEFRTINFKESTWKQSAPVVVRGSVVGKIDVSYLEERPDLDEGPFIKEERLLINAIAERLGHIIGRRQAERLLVENEERYKVMFEKNPLSVLIIDPQNGQIVDANPKAVEYLGWTYEEIISKKLFDINNTPKDELLKNLQVQSRLNRNTIIQKYVLKTGEVRDVEIFNCPIELHGKTLINSISFDITERLLAEGQVRQHLIESTAVAQVSTALRQAQNEEQLLKVLLDELLLVMDAPAGSILVHNTGMDAFIPSVQHGWIKELNPDGLSYKNDFIRKVFSCSGFIIPEVKVSQLFLSSITSTLPSGWQAACLPFGTGQERFGVVILFAPQARVVSEKDLQLLSMVCEIGAIALQRVRMHANLEASYNALQNEISIRRGMEELLAKEKELLSASLLSIGEGVISTDQDGHVVLLNHAAGMITGYSSAEALGQPIGKIFHLVDHRTQQATPDPLVYLHQLEDEEKTNPNYRSPTLVTKTGEKILVSGKITPIRVQQELIDGYILVFDNVTDKEQQNAQSTLSQKMEAIGQLAAGIAHEINTPIQYVGDNVNFLNRAFSRFKEINAIYSSLLDDHIGKPFTAEEAQALSEIIKNKKIDHYMQEFPMAVQETLDGVERVRKIVMAIREFSHPSQKEMKLSDINQSILTTITISRNEWKYCADLVTDLDPDLPLVWCQIDEINQVILNMIVNSAQAIQDQIEKTGEEKGQIWIKTRQKEDKATISIQDTGGGIPADILNRVFDPFFTTKGVGRGTGQGLSIAHNIIVKKHGGTIQVTPKEGLGTTFIIELPINIPDEGGSGEPTKKTNPVRG